MDENDVSHTRVFISDLPPNFTSTQLGAHFAQKYPITDAVVLPGRRIGFVGFKNHTLAQDAAKYFNKTYVRMSKISVEMAKPVELNRTYLELNGSSSTNGQAPPIIRNGNTLNSKKRKREDATVATQDHLPMDYTSSFVKSSPAENGTVLDGPQSSGLRQYQKTRKIDANSEAHLEAKARIVPVEAVKNQQKVSNTDANGTEAALGAVVAGANAETRSQEEESRKKKQRDLEDPSNATEATKHKIEDNATKRMRKEAQRPKDISQVDDKAEVEVESLNQPALGSEVRSVDTSQLEKDTTEADWLRGKTSRLLDILDPDELSENRATHKTNHVNDEAKRAQLDPIMKMPASKQTTVVESTGNRTHVPNGRLFVRNLPFTTTEEDLESLFSQYGKITEIHISKDFRTATSKGVAYVQFTERERAEQALQALDTTSYQGRLLHVLPASDKKSSKLDDFEISKLPLKKQKALKRRMEAANSAFSWNSMYMNPDVVLSSVAERLGVAKNQLLDPTSADAAVKQAHAETSIIQETKAYLQSNGIHTEAFKNKARDRTSLLLKNFAFGTTHDELRDLLEPFGVLRKVVIPPSGTIAIALFESGHSVDQAFKHLAYRNVKGSVLFLERGPEGLFDGTNKSLETNKGSAGHVMPSEEDSTNTEAATHLPSTLFVRNLNFSTTSDRLQEVFKPLPGFLSARIKTRTEPKRPGEVLSMGFGFAEFRSKPEADAAAVAMNGYKLDNHELLVKPSHRSADAAEERRREDLAKRSGANKTKIIIKNLPFEATKKDIRSLFGAYGQLRTVRVPKKFDNSTRGFAFADFVTAKEAENAMEALSNTHLLGRRIILEFAAGETVNPEEEIVAIEKKMDKQNERVHINKITGSARRKFNVTAADAEF